MTTATKPLSPTLSKWDERIRGALALVFLVFVIIYAFTSAPWALILAIGIFFAGVANNVVDILRVTRHTEALTLLLVHQLTTVPVQFDKSKGNEVE